MSVLHKSFLLNPDTDSSIGGGEMQFVHHLLKKWGIRKQKRYSSLHDLLASEENPSKIRLSWYEGCPDLWNIISRGVSVRDDRTEFSRLELQLRQTIDKYGICEPDPNKQLSPDFVGVAFKRNADFFIYSVEYFPTHNVTSSEENPEKQALPPENRKGGLVCFSAGEFATRRILIPEHLADYGRQPKEKKVVVFTEQPSDSVGKPKRKRATRKTATKKAARKKAS